MDSVRYRVWKSGVWSGNGLVVEHRTQVCGVGMGSVRCRVWNSGVWSGNGLCSL